MCNIKKHDIYNIIKLICPKSINRYFRIPPENPIFGTPPKPPFFGPPPISHSNVLNLCEPRGPPYSPHFWGFRVFWILDISECHKNDVFDIHKMSCFWKIKYHVYLKIKYHVFWKIKLRFKFMIKCGTHIEEMGDDEKGRDTILWIS